jgi:putative acetyltransferase
VAAPGRFDGVTVAIRPERPADAEAVRLVTVLAFGQPDEARIVDRLRERAPVHLGLVASDGESIVGHILFTPVPLRSGERTHTVVALAPMSVLPAWQRRGVGAALVHEGLAACRAAGHDVVVVVGHPEYYPRFGFVPARPLGLTSEPAFADEAFMVAELTPGALRGRRGVIVYGPEFLGGSH